MRAFSIHRLVLGLSTVILLSLGGCGGSDKSCSDACNALFACGDKLGVAPKDFLGSAYTTVSSCMDRCSTGDCAKKQQLLNCVGGLQCTNLTQAQNEVTACFTNANCAP